jgi:hypothetical protein
MWKEAFSALALDGLERRDRTGLINAISGIRTAFLAISGKDGNWNAGVFTNVTHVGANPASMSILFRPDNGKRHTYTNYKTFKRITLVALPEKEMQRLHDCSASYDASVFEWEHLNGTCTDLSGWTHPIPTTALWAVELEWSEGFTLKNNCLYTVGLVKNVGLSHALVRSDRTLHFEMPPLLALGLQHYFTPKSVGHLPFPEVKSTLNDI